MHYFATQFGVIVLLQVIKCANFYKTCNIFGFLLPFGTL